MQEYSVVISLINGDKIEFNIEGHNPKEVKGTLTNTAHGPWKFIQKGEEYIWFDINHIVSVSIEKTLF